MSQIQTDVSEAALVAATRANMSAFFRYLGRTDPTENFEDEKFSRWFTPLPHPWFNGVLCHQEPEQADESFIAETIQYFKSKKVNVFTWWLMPHLRPADWEKTLSAYGFGFSADTPGMAMDLLALNGSAGAVPGLEIRLVDEAGLLHTWVEMFVRGYGLPADWSSAIFDIWMKLGLDFPVRNFLGYWHGEPVSTSSIFYGGGAAGIYDVATLPEVRGKGIGAALTLHPLVEARARGYRVGTLQSSEMGFSVYKKLGFKHVCQIENYYLALERA
jgi:ribosomal protein S18 acetylase RimI-like enzyme